MKKFLTLTTLLFVFNLFAQPTVALRQLEVPPGTANGQVMIYYAPAHMWYPGSVILGLDPTMFTTSTNGSATLINIPASIVSGNLTNGLLALVVLNATIGTATVTNFNADIITAPYVQATLGFSSFKNNGSPPTAISVGASPFSYTNTQPVNIQLTIDANLAATALTFNGGTIFVSKTNVDHSVILQPNDYVTVTYSIATPVMKYREF